MRAFLSFVVLALLLGACSEGDDGGRDWEGTMVISKNWYVLADGHTASVKVIFHVERPRPDIRTFDDHVPVNSVGEALDPTAPAVRCYDHAEIGKPLDLASCSSWLDKLIAGAYGDYLGDPDYDQYSRERPKGPSRH